MHWVLAKNLNSDGQYENLLEQITRQGYEYTLVGVVPFSGEVAVVEGSKKLEDIEGKVFCCGKGSMKRVSALYDWSPGYIETVDYITSMRGYGMHLLNHDAVVGKLSEVVPIEEKFFIRPNADDKSFNGQLMTRSVFLDWQKQMSAMEDSATITKNDIIILAPVKEIYAEYRFYVVQGEVVTGSLYKSRDKVIYSSHIDEKVTQFAQEMANLFDPSWGYVLDIADTPDGFKVLETNSISSSGFYAIDMAKFVNSISNIY